MVSAHTTPSSSQIAKVPDDLLHHGEARDHRRHDRHDAEPRTDEILEAPHRLGEHVVEGAPLYLRGHPVGRERQHQHESGGERQGERDLPVHPGDHTEPVARQGRDHEGQHEPEEQDHVHDLAPHGVHEDRPGDGGEAIDHDGSPTSDEPARRREK
jgi:hypothetical protein